MTAAASASLRVSTPFDIMYYRMATFQIIFCIFFPCFFELATLSVVLPVAVKRDAVHVVGMSTAAALLRRDIRREEVVGINANIIDHSRSPKQVSP